MKKFSPVPLPKRVVTVSNNSGTYVYLTQKVVYSKSTKKSAPQRITIGKLDSNGMLIPNHNYIELFGEDIDLKIAPERSDSLSFGPQLVVDKIAKQTGLDEILEEILPEYKERILDIATFMIMEGKNAVYEFEEYGYKHSLFNVDIFSDSTIGNIFKEIRVKDIDLFINKWVKRHTNKDSKIYIAYDSTNMNCVAEEVELAEYGYSKDDPSLPQVNVSIAYDQLDQLPLFFEVYPGSIIDNTECSKMIERANHYGCKDVGFILDRGYFSLENIKYFDRNGFDYIIMTKGGSNFVKEAIDLCGAMVRNGYSCYLKEHELFGTTVEMEIFKTYNNNKKQYVHVYYDGIKAGKEKIDINNRYDMVDKYLEEKVLEKLNRKEDVIKYDKYYKLKFDENGYFVSFQRKEKYLKELIDRAGHFVIITSKKMSASEARQIYLDRDAVEKIFRMEKSYLGSSVFRVHSTERLEAKMFITFIATIIRNEIHNLTKGLYEKNKTEYTVPLILKQIDRLSLTRYSDEKYHLRYSLTKKQKDILKAIGINEKEYSDYADMIKAHFN